ncbi:flavin monoamine oxidase family protein [Pandoraea pulmonicola]|uniref:Amine oxidase n=1 Tax=Pandoraea pulmonicola TaxID=93221 RepID=A0AAJ5CYN9_PANPU|nr:FAD-dependent oxidoreductase [Pandoraea pulmonicola]AJC22196.1 amine oxidase [Pandoraea pulmonicola]SUA88763.1 Putrescine oxidase [Pandoraea pulmonicola]
MLKARVAIIGGGLSGLYAAALLEERGMRDYVLLEARETLGGRILSMPRGSDTGDAGSPSDIGRFDLGATWFWPDLQPGLARLVDELGLATFEQHEAGDMLVERSSVHRPSRVNGYRSAPASLRVVGGMDALIEALRDRLTADRLICGCHVKRLVHLGGEGVEVQADDMLGRPVVYRVAHVLLAVPPRLAVHALDFTPTLPHALVQQWKNCATWMAPHAKYVAVFDKPFWREQGLSGEARSSVGPLTEIHDASSEGGHAALFGFLGVPAHVRAQVAEADLFNHCRAQLVRLFGSSAALPQVELLKDWASDPYTAVAADQRPGLHQSLQLLPTALSGTWRNQLIGIASEWSPEFSGYLAGAVDAARRGVEVLTAPNAASSLLH